MLTIEEVAERITRAEAALTSRMRAYRPLVEVYIQNLATDERLGTVPTGDEYFIGQFDWTDSQGPKLLALSPPKGSLRQKASVFSHPFSAQYLPDGFAATSVPDWRLLDRQRYAFTYVKREFLGEARCLVLDVRPKLDRLSKSGLLAPAGGVDSVLETVVNNLEVTNNLTVEPTVRCRVLLTSPLESFTIGHTIVLSRGLVDVLPDEASLAMMLAHELSHMVLGHQLIDTKFAFADRLMVPDGDLLQTLQFRHTPREESAADAKVLELLKNSPYKDKLSDAGLFLRAIAANAKQLSNLIRPHMGDHIADSGQVPRLGELMQQAPALAPERLDQIAALPLGARLVVNPWNGRVDLAPAEAVALHSAREKVPFAVTPLMPYIKYAEPSTPASAAAR